MKINIISTEFYEWGVYGGFGMFTRKLGKELVKRGIEVEAFMPKFSNLQKTPGEYELIDGVQVKTLPRVRHKPFNLKMYKTDADIIHSECNPLDTYLTFFENPKTPKIITFQDIRTPKDLDMLRACDKGKLVGEAMTDAPKKYWYRVWYSFVEGLYKIAIRHADYITTQTELLVPKVKKMYDLRQHPFWLPNFIDVPTQLSFSKKYSVPSVAWLARTDPIKHPELCLEVASVNPEVQFYVMGHSHWPHYDDYLIQKYKDAKNIHWIGMVNEEQKNEALSKCWVLMNTSYYEALPITFLEAMSYGCSIVSTQNPDRYTEKFGAWSKEQTVRGVHEKLKWILQDERWRALGTAGYNFVKENHETNKCVNQHITLYKKLLGE